MEREPGQMKRPVAIISVIGLVGLLSFSDLGKAGEGPVSNIDSAGLTNQVIGQEAALSLESMRGSHVFREIASISGDHSGKGTRIMPYIGAGFGHGYSSDVDRSLNSSSSGPTDPCLRTLFRKAV